MRRAQGLIDGRDTEKLVCSRKRPITDEFIVRDLLFSVYDPLHRLFVDFRNKKRVALTGLSVAPSRFAVG